tara:strand:- start:491 stop:637 length:147 start_codon:yes stop_codon:yes gene_type:complete
MLDGRLYLISLLSPLGKTLGQRMLLNVAFLGTAKRKSGTVENDVYDCF